MSPLHPYHAYNVGTEEKQILLARKDQFKKQLLKWSFDSEHILKNAYFIRSKLYAMEYSDFEGKIIQDKTKAKGIKLKVACLTPLDYKYFLVNNLTKKYVKQCNIYSRKYQLFIKKTKKLGLSNGDNKRYVISNSKNCFWPSLALGHKQIQKINPVMECISDMLDVVCATTC